MAYPVISRAGIRILRTRSKDKVDDLTKERATCHKGEIRVPLLSGRGIERPTSRPRA